MTSDVLKSKIIYIKDKFSYDIKEVLLVQELSDKQSLCKYRDEFVIINKTDIPNEELTSLNNELTIAKKLKIEYTAKAEEMSKLVDELISKILK